MKVHYNYLPEEFRNPEKIISEWKKLIKSSDFTLGSYIERFESEFSRYIGSKFCIATNNGTDALILSLKSLNIGDGDEVITVCNSFYATAGAIVAVGAKPVFCDCDDRYQISIEDIKKKISKKTKAILPVHWGGASPDMNLIINIAKKNKLFVIEDACMGIGAKIGTKSPGTFGNVNAFSMHPLKSLNVMGDAGAVVTNDKNIYNWMKKYRNHGMIDRDNIDFWGVNNRMQPLQAIVALHGLKKLESVLRNRNKNASFYDSELSKGKITNFVRIPKRKKKFKETFALYMILCKDRDNLKKFLEKKNIEVKVHYPIPLHLQKAAMSLGYKSGNFLIAEKQSQELLTLPVHQFLNKEQLKYTVFQIKKFYNV